MKNTAMESGRLSAVHVSAVAVQSGVAGCLVLCATAEAAGYGARGGSDLDVAGWLLSNVIGLVVWTGWCWLAARFFRAQPGIAECLVASLGMVVLSGAVEFCQLTGVSCLVTVAALGALIAYPFWLRNTLSLESAFDGFLIGILPAILLVVIYMGLVNMR